MNYKHFVIHPIEHEPGKWRATIRRADGSAVTCERTKLDSFTTSADTPTSEDAVRLACRAIDAGALS